MSTKPTTSPSTRTRSKTKQKDPPAMSSELLSPSRTPATKRNKQPHGFQVTPEQGQKQTSPKRKVAPKNAIATPKRAPRTKTLQVDTETLKESEKPPEDAAENMHEDSVNEKDGDDTGNEEVGNNGQSDGNDGDHENEDHENKDHEHEDHEEAVNQSQLDQQERERKAERKARKEAKREKKSKKKKKAKKKSKSKSKRKKKTEMEVELEADKTSSEEDEADDNEIDPGGAGTEDNMEVEGNDAGAPNYSEAAQNNAEDDDATVVADNDKWVARRVKISIEIKEPKDKEQRLKLLYSEVNSIMKIGRKAVTSLKMRKFSDMRTPKSDHAKSWFSKFTLASIEADEFCEYMAEGLKTWFPLDRTKFYFRATLVMPEKSSLDKMLEKMGHYLPNTTKVSDSLSQLIYEPKKVGYLLRSNSKMTSSDEFVNELNRIAHQYNPKVHFGISYSEMKNPNGQKAKNWSDAIKAVLLETNESEHREATDIALNIFPGKR